MRRLPSKCILTMFHLYFFILISCVLLSQKIILINEESLILFCFILTINILIQNFNTIKNSTINEYILQENTKLKFSFLSLVKSLESTKHLKIKNISATIQFIIDYKNYWLLWCKNFLVWISLDLLYSAKTNYCNLFVILKSKEQTFLNIFHLQLYYKLSKKFILDRFITNKILNSKLMSRNLVNIRNWAVKQNYQIFINI